MQVSSYTQCKEVSCFMEFHGRVQRKKVLTGSWVLVCNIPSSFGGGYYSLCVTTPFGHINSFETATHTPGYTVGEPSQPRGHGTSVVYRIGKVWRKGQFLPQSGYCHSYRKVVESWDIIFLPLLSVFLFGAALLTDNVTLPMRPLIQAEITSFFSCGSHFSVFADYNTPSLML